MSSASVDDLPGARGLVAVALAVAGLAACVIVDEPGGDEPDHLPDHADEHGDGCGGALTDREAYLALPLVTAPPATFTLAILDIGQGDAAVLQTPSGCTAIFDSGPTGAGAVIKPNLAALGITRLDVAFVSHYHADHLGGLDELERGVGAVPITTVFDRGGAYTTAAYEQYAAWFAGRRVTATVGQVIDLCGEVTLRVVAVGGNGLVVDDENGLSLAVRITYGAFDALIGGDLTGNVPDLESLVASAIGPVELYRVHHHGSATSSNPALLAALRPTVSFISLGANNIFGHPAPSTLDRLDAATSSVWLTENPATGTKGGPIVVTSTTGDTFVVTQGGLVVEYPSKGVVDTGPPTAPTDLAATATPTSVSLQWTAATDDLAVVDYLVYRDGAALAITTDPAFLDGAVMSSRSYTYAVAARDAAGNVSPSSPSLTVATPCDVAITARTWNATRRQLTVRATCSRPTARLTVSADGADLGPMLRGFGDFTFTSTLPSRPTCVEVTASCGDRAVRCF